MSERLQELGGLLIGLTGAGLSLPDACAKAGVSLSTVKGWLAHGRRDESGPYRAFADAIDAARSARQPDRQSAEPATTEPPIFAVIDALAERRRS